MMAMLHDRMPMHAVAVDGNVEEMDVDLEPIEIRAVLKPEEAARLLTGRFVLEPWVRVDKGADWEVSMGIEAKPVTEDGA